MKPTLLIPAILAFSLVGCGTFKKTTNVENEAVKTEILTNTVETKTLTEKASTTVTTQADTARATKHLDNLLNGDTLKTETDHTSINVFFNHETGEIDATAVSKPQIIPVEIERSIVTKNETSTLAKSDTEKESRHEDKERESGTSTFLWGIISVLIPFILILIYIIYRRVRNKILP